MKIAVKANWWICIKLKILPSFLCSSTRYLKFNVGIPPHSKEYKVYLETFVWLALNHQLQCHGAASCYWYRQPTKDQSTMATNIFQHLYTRTIITASTFPQEARRTHTSFECLWRYGFVSSFSYCRKLLSRTYNCLNIDRLSCSPCSWLPR